MLVIPGTMLWLSDADSSGLWRSVPASRFIRPVIGGLCICLGLIRMVATIRLFVTIGKAAIATWEPTQRLAVQGVYRRVRNPMISGVVLVLLGESVLTASLLLFCWFQVVAAVNAAYIPLWEEPGLSSNALANSTWPTSGTCQDGFRGGRRGTAGRETSLKWVCVGR
jgi:protein-S-isoprenylcysteine O-methyltransferase Ste14